MVVALVLVTLVITMRSMGHSGNRSKVEAQDFTLTSVKGRATHQPWGHGHPAVLGFFASWCAPCRAELPVVAHYVATHDLGDVRVLGIEGDASVATADAFLRLEGVTFDVVLDPNEVVTAGRFGFAGFPDTAFISSTGVIIRKQIGAISESQFAHEIRVLNGT